MSTSGSALLRKLLLAALVAGTCLLVGIQTAAAAPAAVTCADSSFSGTARDVIVPSGTGCDLSGATVTRDVIVETNSGVFAERLSVGRNILLGQQAGLQLAGAAIGRDLTSGPDSSIQLERTTVGHDLLANQVQTLQTGTAGPDSPGGPVTVEHDVELNGSPAGEPFVFDGIRNLRVGRDFRMLSRSVTLGAGIGDQCAPDRPANTVGHALIVANSSALVGFFGPSAIAVGGNRVGHDIVFTGNSAAPGGYLEVADNFAGHDAICANNSPPPSFDSAGDGPNVAGHRNTCG